MEDVELDDTWFVEPPPDDMLTDLVELMLLLSPAAPESCTGVADVESLVAYAPCLSPGAVESSLKIFEETAKLTPPDRLLPSTR
jgi:hypothetical protein